MAASSCDLYISKRAVDMSTFKDEIVRLWSPTKGPFQNVFGLLSYAIPFVPGLGWGIFALEKIASLFGLGLDDLGKWIDEQCNIPPGAGANEMASCLGKVLQGIMDQKKADLSTDQIEKVAFWGFAVSRMLPVALKWVARAIGAILLAVGANNIGDVNNIVAKAKEIAVDTIKENITPEMVSEFITPEMFMKGLTQGLQGEQ